MALQAQTNVRLSPEQEFQNKVAEVRNHFARSLPKQRAELSDLFLHIQEGREAGEALNGIRGIAHKIRGIAPTLGFVEMGTFAAHLEDTIFAFNNPDENHDNIAQTFVRHFQALVDEMGQAHPV